MIQQAERINILNLSREQLEEWLAGRGIAAYRAGQILKWIYRRQQDSFADMSDIAKDVRALLPQHFRIPRLEVMALQSSADGTRKYLFGLEDGESIESVLIPERDHYTMCVSSQAGCAQNCRFCLTAKSPLRRNLSPGEILGQVRDIKNDLPAPEQLTNLVFMGMGEPLANFDNLISALALKAMGPPAGMAPGPTSWTVGCIAPHPAERRRLRQRDPANPAVLPPCPAIVP